MRITKRSAYEAGSCNFCDGEHRTVYEIQSSGKYGSLKARVCPTCAREFRTVTREDRP